MKIPFVYTFVILLFVAALHNASYSQVESAREKVKSEKKAKKSKKNKPKADTPVIQPQKEQPAQSALNTEQTADIYEMLAGRSADVVVESTNGSVNWTGQYIEARGESVIDTVRFKNKAQARAMAVRGAVVVAQRNLLEIINGVKVHGETTVENMITTNDYIYTRVDGIIKGAQMVGEPIEKWGMMTVTLKAPLYQENGLASAVYEAVPSMPGKENIQTGDGFLKVGEVSEGTAAQIQNFVFEMGGKKFDPALFPVIVDENNNVLLDLYKIYDPKKGKFPKILQASRQLMQDLGIEKGVEIIDVIDAYDGKLVIGEKAKKKIDWEKVLKTVTTIGKALVLLI